METEQPAGTISVAVVDDDEEVRGNLQWMIDHADGYRCCGVFDSGTAAIEGLVEPLPDVVLMDIGLPDISGIECVRELKKRHPRLRVIMQTVYSDDDKIFESLRAGAVGYILKKSPLPRLLQAVADAAQGGAPMSGEIARRVLAYFQQPAEDDAMDSLSQREHEVLEELIEGRSYKAIADKLFLSIHTVRFHVHHIYEKLHVRSRAEFMARMMSHRRS